MTPRVLVVSPFGLGDAIFAFPLIEAIRAAHPEARIDFVANERTKDLIAMNPSVNHVYEFNRDSLRALSARSKIQYLRRLWNWRRTIAAARYEVAFDLSLGREYSLFLAFCGVPKRIGFDYKGRGFFLTHKTPIAGLDGKPVREAYLDLLKSWLPDAPAAIRYPALKPASRAEWDAWAAAHGLPPGAPYAVVAPGGGRSWGRHAHYKQWDPGKFAALARRLVDERGLKVILAGDGGELELCDKVRRLAGQSGVEAMAGESLGLVTQAIAGAQFFVGNDGGLMHLADLAGTRLVGIYGPVDERAYGPRAGARAAVVTRAVECRPCYANFRFPPCPHSKRCLEEIGLGDVLTSLDKVLKGS